MIGNSFKLIRIYKQNYFKRVRKKKGKTKRKGMRRKTGRSTKIKQKLFF